MAPAGPGIREPGELCTHFPAVSRSQVVDCPPGPPPYRPSPYADLSPPPNGQPFLDTVPPWLTRHSPCMQTAPRAQQSPLPLSPPPSHASGGGGEAISSFGGHKREPSPSSFHHSPAAPAFPGAPRSPGAPLSPLTPGGPLVPVEPCMPGAPTSPEEGTHWDKRCRECVQLRTIHPSLQGERELRRRSILAGVPPRRQTGKHRWRECGGKATRPAWRCWSGLFQRSELAVGPTRDCAISLPSPSRTGHVPTTYLWAQPLLWGLVCPEVLRSPASLRDPLCQLDQAYLEVPEVLGKRTGVVSDTKSCWKWERMERRAVTEVREAASS